VDFISWLFALIGIGSDRAMHRSDRRAEVVRLNAEVASEAGRTLDIIAAAMPRLTRRCAQVCGDNPEMCGSMVKVLNDQRDAALKISKMAEDYKAQITEARGFIDWDNTLHQFQEWRANASRMTPWVQDIVNRYDAILYEAGAR
jgi:hypothetical protein